MAERYLKKQFSKLKSQEPLKAGVTSLLSKIPLKVLKTSKPSKSSHSLDTLIIKYFKKLDMGDVELNLRRAKLREAKRAKHELEGKLQHLTDSIQSLNFIEDITKSKPNLQDHNIRQEYFELEKIKSKEVQKKTKEYFDQQKKRKAKIERHLKELQKEIDLEKDLKQQEMKEKEEERKKNYEKYLEKIREKAEMRKKELQDSKSYVQGGLRVEKPLYVKISEKFWKDTEMPELEKRKEELNKKRMINSYNSQQIIEHAKWYVTVKTENKKKYDKELKSMSIDRAVRSGNSTITIWQQKIKEDERHQKEEKMKEHEQLLRKIDKRTQYASLVKEMYKPNINTLKQKEIEGRKLKYMSSERVLNSKPISTIPEKIDWKPHKFKPNPMLPKKPESKKSPEIKDYLRKIREDREKEGEENEEKSEKNENFLIDVQELEKLPEEKRLKTLQKASKKLEKEIKKRELASVKSSLNLKESDEINEMLISSIKAKLAVLEKSKEI